MVGSFQCRKVCKYSLPSSYYTLQRCCWGYRNGRCKNWGTGRCEKGPKWAMKERSINKRWLFIPIKDEYSPLSLAVQRLHLWLLSCSNYWLAGAFEKSTIKPGIWKKNPNKKQKTAARFLPGTVIDEALRNNTATDASSPTVNYGSRLPAYCFHIFLLCAARTIVIDDYKNMLASESLLNCSAWPTQKLSFTCWDVPHRESTHKLFQQANEISMHTRIESTWAVKYLNVFHKKK